MDSWIVVEREGDVQNTLKDVALPVHLLRQVPKLTFFRLFSHLFLDIVFYCFLIDFGRLLGSIWGSFGTTFSTSFSTSFSDPHLSKIINLS